MTPGFRVSLFDAIASALGADLTLESGASGPLPGTDPFADRSFDLGWVCSTSFVDLSLRSVRPSVQLVGVGWAPLDPDSNGRPQYFGDLVVAEGVEARHLEDLAGLRIGCNDPVSLSGYQSLRFEIARQNLDPERFQLTFTGGHRTSLEWLAEGKLDAAVIDSVVYSTSELKDRFTRIQRMGPWPTQPLIARSDLAPELVASVRSQLLESNADPKMQRELRLAGLDRFVATDDSHYEPVAAAMRSLTQ